MIKVKIKNILKEAAKMICPPATQDLKLNTTNRDAAIQACEDVEAVQLSCLRRAIVAVVGRCRCATASSTIAQFTDLDVAWLACLQTLRDTRTRRARAGRESRQAVATLHTSVARRGRACRRHFVGGCGRSDAGVV